MPMLLSDLVLFFLPHRIHHWNRDRDRQSSQLIEHPTGLGRICHHHCRCWPRRSTAMRAQRQAAAFAAKDRATRGNADVKRDDAHPPPKDLVGAGSRNGFRFVDQTT
jgi:hypothetical protein